MVVRVDWHVSDELWYLELHPGRPRGREAALVHLPDALPSSRVRRAPTMRRHRAIFFCLATAEAPGKISLPSRGVLLSGATTDHEHSATAATTSSPAVMLQFILSYTGTVGRRDRTLHDTTTSRSRPLSESSLAGRNLSDRTSRTSTAWRSCSWRRGPLAGGGARGPRGGGGYLA